MNCYHIPNPEDRGKVISFVERNVTQLFAASIKCSNFPSPEIDYYRCPADCGGLAPLKYHYGYMSNNQDEFLTGDCNRCGTSVFYEPNFD